MEVRSFKFPSGNNLADVRKNLATIWAHSNSLIKNLTHFEDNVENRLLSFLRQSICKQPEQTFIKMASLKIDFHFEVFRQLKNHVLCYLLGAP